MFDFQHPHADVVLGSAWSNYTGTISKKIPLWCSLKASKPGDVSGLRRNALVIQRLLDKCFAPPAPQPIRVTGSKWSFSSVLEPSAVVLDPGNMSFTSRVATEHLSASYAARSQQNFVPFYAQGGTGIATLNKRLGQQGLALQTSGGGNGHRIAGCIATGTHGSALEVGAVHDTVLAMHLITSPNTAVLLQPSSEPFTPALADWLQKKTGIATQNIVDDVRFRAAQVSLGSLGIVFGVILETAPIYELDIRRFNRRFAQDDVWHAMRTLDTSGLNDEFHRSADHFEVVLLPYPGGDRSALFVTLMWKRPAPQVPFRSPAPGLARQSSDTIGLIGGLANTFSGPLTSGLVREVIQAQIHGQLRDGNKPAMEKRFPGEVFGPTTLPAGMGASTELALSHKDASRALNTIFDVLERQAQQGRFLLGCIAVRFTKRSHALLAMNQHEKTCHIELPSIRNDDVLQIFRAVWRELEREKISFTCHWGQLGNFTPARTQSYFGANAAQWTAARNQLLHGAARQVFAAPLLVQAGL